MEMNMLSLLIDNKCKDILDGIYIYIWVGDMYEKFIWDLKIMSRLFSCVRFSYGSFHNTFCIIYLREILLVFDVSNVWLSLEIVGGESLFLLIYYDFYLSILTQIFVFYEISILIFKLTLIFPFFVILIFQDHFSIISSYSVNLYWPNLLQPSIYPALSQLFWI